ncbi:MAG: hypothetical protein HYV28_13400 [Ignavibacteriales bacterium]|nr:hypothetical protein [Ignavibacteriales bacterium]
MKRVFLIIALLSITHAFGQSVYSQYGIGALVKSSSVRNTGMGSQGISFTESDAYNSLNPATLSQIDFTRIEFGVSANGLFLKNDAQSKYYSQVFFGGFSLAFPVYKAWGIGSAIGLQPYSTINYEINSKVIDNLTGNYTEKFTGSGGINKFFWNTSYVLPYNFQFGLGYNFYFGRSEYNTHLEFDNSAYSKGQFSTRYDVKGSGILLGLISPELVDYVGKGSLNSLKAGFTYDMISKLATDYEMVATSSVTEDKVDSNSGRTNIPGKLSFGLAAQLKNKMILSLDYTTQAWSKYTRMDKSDTFLKNMQRISLGLSTRSYKESGIDFDQPVYRFGVSYEQTPLRVNGKDINELSISAGLTFPISWRNYVETALTYTMRGSTEAKLVKENTLRLDASLNLGEIWFIQQDR